MKTTLIILLCTLSIVAQEKDPYKILESVKEKFNSIQDYQVDATITVDINFLRVPESHAKVYFKQPDKIKLDSEGFALLPKEGINFSPVNLLNNDFNAIYSKSDSLGEKLVDVIKIIPASDSSGVILTTLWIDDEMDIVVKMETTTKRSGTFELEMNYEKSSYDYLPSEVKLTFRVSEIQIQKTITGDLNENEEPRRKRDEPMTGTVIINYENYKVNQGLEDSLFVKEKR